MRIRIFQLDAFADQLFSGNPAAVCPLDQWLPDDLMQKIAAENNLSETAFFVGADGRYDLRWFTPLAEVDLCGHATLASAAIVLEELEPQRSRVEFDTRSGRLSVRRQDKQFIMDFPAQAPRPAVAPPTLLRGMGRAPEIVLASQDYFLVYSSQSEIEALAPDLSALKDIPLRGVIVTAPGDMVDFVSRFFGPKVGIDEDPVTGSAHCALAPYWAERIGKKQLIGRQLSSRGGTVVCGIEGERVSLSGKCARYLEGSLRIA